ncbi:MAG: exopolysaccharide biosynthesis protein [Kofleriaceae bacterium]
MSSPERPPPRRLRLGELLAELGALDDEAAAASASAARGAEHITLGEIVDRSAEAGFGFLLALLALVAIPFFGLSTPFGLAIAVCGAQMLVGGRRPWLPRALRRRRLTLAMLDRIAGMLARRTRWLSRITRRRGEALLVGVGWGAIGLGVVILGLGLALPLPIPGSNMIFLVPILIYAVGALERDGVLVALGHLAVVINVVALIVFGRLVLEALLRVWAWLT